MTWNVRGFRGGVGAAVDVVRSADPDLLLLQETGRRARLSAFVRALELRVVEDPPSFPWRRVKDAIGVRKPWTVESRGFQRFEGSRPWYPRGAAVADVGLGPARLRAVSTHLGLRPGERAAHARQLLAIVDGYAGPAVVGGDLNARPSQDAPMLLAERLHDAWEAAIGGGRTYPAASPSSRIDYLFVTGQIEVVDADVVGSVVSDHLPVVAELDLPGG
jgi:endonuclease/exonuclease/phosphatase family metal-dependent hydrolase